jgi:hypothetical protein
LEKSKLAAQHRKNYDDTPDRQSDSGYSLLSIPSTANSVPSGTSSSFGALFRETRGHLSSFIDTVAQWLGSNSEDRLAADITLDSCASAYRQSGWNNTG